MDTTLDIFGQITFKIIKEQELIIGPLAWIEAGKVEGLEVINSSKGEIVFKSSDKKEVINRLVNQYNRLFGRASHEVCKGAVATMLADLPPSEVPSSLRS